MVVYGCFFLEWYGAQRDRHVLTPSCRTRRSSGLPGAVAAGAGGRARTQILAVADAVAIGIDAAIATARDGIDDRQFAVLCRRHARCVVVEQEEQRQLQA